MGSRLKRLLKTLLKFIITAAALWFVIRKIEVSEVIALYRQANPWLILLALVAFALSKFVSAYRLQIYFRAINLSIPQKSNLQLYLLGMFYNLFLPGGIGGDGYKIYLLQKEFQTGTRRILGAVLADRISGMVALMVLALTGISLLNPSANPQFAANSFQLSIVNCQLSIVNFSFLLIPFVFLGYYLFIKFIYPYFLGINLITFGWGFIVQLLQVLSAWLLLLALGETDHHLAYLVIFLVSSVVAVLPISIGGVGVRELTFLYGSQLLNVDMNIAVGISFLFYAVTAVVSFIGVFYLFRPIQFKES